MRIAVHRRGPAADGAGGLRAEQWGVAAGPEFLRARPVRRIPVLQGLYFLVTGIWPLLSMRTFEAVTGPKVDRWLVKTVGVLVAVIGASLLADARRPSRGSQVLGVGSAAALGGVDVVYSPRGRISKIYLLDAVVEALLITLWAVGGRRPRRLIS